MGKGEEKKLKLTKAKDLTYGFEFFAPVGETLQIVPTTLKDSNLLFSPASVDISVENECVKNIIFTAKTGLIISG